MTLATRTMFAAELGVGGGVAVAEHAVDLAADDFEAGDRIGGHSPTSRAEDGGPPTSPATKKYDAFQGPDACGLWCRM
jgi:hypothetical protein